MFDRYTFSLLYCFLYIKYLLRRLGVRNLSYFPVYSNIYAFGCNIFSFVEFDFAVLNPFKISQFLTIYRLLAINHQNQIFFSLNFFFLELLF